MSNGNWNQNEETSLAEFLIARVCDRARGRIEDECLSNYPRDVYFIGNLRPRPDTPVDLTTQPDHFSELRNKLAPVAFGAEFMLRLEGESSGSSIDLKWACYYRIFPTLSQQRAHQQQETASNAQNTNVSESVTTGRNECASEDVSEGQDETVVVEQEIEGQIAESESSEIIDSACDRQRGRLPQDSLFIRFRKIYCEASGRVVISRGPEGQWSVECSDLQASINREVLRAQQVALNDPERVRTNGDVTTKIRVPNTALVSEETYRDFQRSLHVEVNPIWMWEVRGESRANSSTNPTERIVGIEFVNTSPMADNLSNAEAYLFDSEATFVFIKREILPFELELVARGFRFDRHLWGRGTNCSVQHIASDSLNAIFVTTHTPIYQQLRFATHSNPTASFADLARDPIPTLETIGEAMEDYCGEWEQERQRYIANDSTWEAKCGTEFGNDRRRFDEEIRRFRRGLELIRTNDDIRLAFQLTNETFRRGVKTDWRLFQVVFLVSQIPGIAALTDPSSPDASDRDRVDIIYFPTGGGKTEAYLATIVFHCFFDRLRGKTAGITAWTRFPLRLLTLQQTQRVADVIGTAELVRRGHSDPRLNGIDIDGFAVGYFVGQGGSPNEIVNPQVRRNASVEEQVTWSKVIDQNIRQDWKRVHRCPACHTSTVSIDFDVVQTRLIHRCSQPGCLFPNGEIPVYIVDNEIYRNLPCVIVGTIDKLAGIGNQRKFSLLFGQVDGNCLQHGYYKGKCCQKDCSSTQLHQGVPLGISGPTLFVQDELHLLKEGLGTFDAHYETFTQSLLQEFGQTPHLKIIASSATIEAFDRQVMHIYGRGSTQAQIFPGLGPTLGHSFYAETLPYPQRIFVGIISHNKTIFNTILEIIELYHREIQALQHLPTGAPNPYGGTLIPNTQDWGQLLDLYMVSLTYFLANRELNSIRTDLVGDVLPHLRRDGIQEFEISELTGSTTTDDVSRILDKLERPIPPNSPSDAVLATSMISHGVDVDRLNTMIFYGMPRQNGEYIQASSRVGRSHTGIVLTCLHPVRERDQSHYSYFIKFHEFLGRLVEPVAINRWSKFSVNRTLPGLFMAVLLQLIANRSGESNPNRYYMLDFVRRKISDKTLLPEHFIPLLEKAYLVNNAITPVEIALRDEIRAQVYRYFDYILGQGAGQDFVSEVLIPKPMRSLRDVDEPIIIELDSLGSQWIRPHGGH